MSSQLLIVLVVFLAQAFAQAPQPDAACTAWLATPDGQNFTQCEQDFPGLPMKTEENNCVLTQEDFDLFCNDTCYKIMTDSYDWFLSNGTCLSIYEYYFGACEADADCANPALGPRVCIEGLCYNSCNTTDDCNDCYSEVCDTVGTQLVCRSNLTVPNGTYTSTFQGNVYQLHAQCTQNDDDDFCALLFSNVTDMDMSNISCSAFDDWGCCFGQMLTTMQFCAFQRFAEESIYNCSNAVATCGDLPSAMAFCAISVNQTGNGTSNASSSSSGSSGSSGSTGISWTGSTGQVGETGGNSAGTIVISWSLLLGLLLITPALS